MEVVTSARTARAHWQTMIEATDPSGKVVAWAGMSRRDRAGAKLATAVLLVRGALSELVTPARTPR